MQNTTNTTNKWEDVDAKYNDSTNQAPQLLVLDELTMNGNTGQWKIKHLTKPKIKSAVGERYQVTVLNSIPLELIIIKANRRKLVDVGNAGAVKRTTTEYSDKDLPVTLYDFDQKGKTSKVIPADIAGAETKFRSRQIAYVVYNGELLRLQIKGGQVKSSVETITHYFDYIYNVKGDDRLYKRITKVTPTAYSTPLGVSYTLDFSVVEKIEDDGVIELIKKRVVEVGENLKAFDDYQHAGHTVQVNKKSPATSQPNLPDIQLDEDEGEPDWDNDFKKSDDPLSAEHYSQVAF